MNANATVLIPEKEWLIKEGSEKIGSIAKNKKGYVVLCNGKTVTFEKWL